MLLGNRIRTGATESLASLSEPPTRACWNGAASAVDRCVFWFASDGMQRLGSAPLRLTLPVALALPKLLELDLEMLFSTIFLVIGLTNESTGMRVSSLARDSLAYHGKKRRPLKLAYVL